LLADAVKKLSNHKLQLKSKKSQAPENRKPCQGIARIPGTQKMLRKEDLTRLPRLPRTILSFCETVPMEDVSIHPFEGTCSAFRPSLFLGSSFSFVILEQLRKLLLEGFDLRSIADQDVRKNMD
jgi:hypothetical protein